jgi:hypothetical protein
LTDFYALLKQSILARGIRDASQRQAIYAQARSALIRQLAGQDPKPSTADITTRVIEFDRAMRRIEAELVAEMDAADPPPEADPIDDASDEAYGDAADVEHEASGWDVRDEAAEDEDPIAPIEPEAPLRPGRQWRDATASTGGALVRRSAIPPAVLTDDADDLPPPPLDRWSEEEAILADEEAPQAARPRLPPPLRRLGWTLSEKDKVRVLVGAIGALALVLVGLMVFLFLPGRGGSVTLPIDTQGSVRDAASADRVASEKLDVKQSFVLFNGSDPTVFQAPSDNPIHLDSDAAGAFVRVGSSANSTGVKVEIGPGLAASLAGQNIRVVLTTRASADRGALNMRFAYQSGVALSYWQTANLKPTYSPVGMTWIVPQMRTSPTGSDYLLIEPGIPGGDTAVDISAIRIDLLGSAPTT